MFSGQRFAILTMFTYAEVEPLSNVGKLVENQKVKVWIYLLILYWNFLFRLSETLKIFLNIGKTLRRIFLIDRSSTKKPNLNITYFVSVADFQNF